MCPQAAIGDVGFDGRYEYGFARNQKNDFFFKICRTVLEKDIGRIHKHRLWSEEFDKKTALRSQNRLELVY